MDSNPINDANNKSNKTPLEDLSKDELIKKCKGLLSIAQKAKQTKDSLQEENNDLKNKLKEYDVTKEIVENLTQIKLQHVTTIDRLKHQNGELEEGYKKCRKELATVSEQYQNINNENIAYQRQIQRLTDENEELLKQLDQLEKKIEEFNKIGLEQQRQLLAVEKSNAQRVLDNDNIINDSFTELQKTLKQNIAENERLNVENIQLVEKIDNLKLNLMEKDKNILTISGDMMEKDQKLQELEEKLNRQIEIENTIQTLEQQIANKDGDLKVIRNTVTDLEGNIDKLKERIKFYHSKLVKFAGNVKVLKENKNEILAGFKVYIEQVEDWKMKLGTASQKLIDYINTIQLENEELIKQNNLLKETNSKIIQQLEAHKTDDEKSKEIEEIEKVKSDNKKLTDEINNFIKQQQEYKQQIDMLITEKERLHTELMTSVERHQEEIKVFDDQNKKDNREIQSRKEENEKICIEYRKIISKFETDIEINLREMEELRQSNLILHEELQHLKSNEKEFANKTSEEILKLVQENADLTKMNRELLEQTINKQQNSTQTEVEDDEDNDLEKTIATLKRENAEVLSEMNEMNQVLKERGETISKLQAHCEEVMKKLQIYETQANKNVDSICQKEQLIKSLQQQLEDAKKLQNTNELVSEKDKEIINLTNELEALKEKINSNMMESSYVDDNMSTSTMSKAEEQSNRLKELEGSWEERYGKLRNLALKLKAKIRELTAELAKEQSEKSEIQSKLSNNMKMITTLQTQYDKSVDDLEIKKKECSDYLKKLDTVAIDISKDKQKLAESEEIIDNLKRTIEELKKEKASTEAWKQQISSKVQTFRKEQEANKLMKKEFEAQIAKLTAELEAKEQALKTETDCHQQTKYSLEHSNNERKKNSVLNLEMQDYERSVKELSTKLEKKQEAINKMKILQDSQKTKMNALKEQKKLLEERVREAENELETANSVLATQKKQITEFEDLIVQKDNQIQNITVLLETTRSENEELSTELSKLVAEHQKVNSNLKNEKEELRSQNLGLQQSLRETQENLKLKLDELKAVQSDYENYKVRAQSVLRQNQNRDVALEERLAEEVGTLKESYVALNIELNQCRTKIDEISNKNKELTSERDDLLLKYQEANSELEDVKALYDHLSSKHQETILEHNETVRNLKIHGETLAQCYRQQLAEFELRHNREIMELQNKIDKAPSPSETPAFHSQVPPMPREEGEGSESIESINRNSLHPIPLERLLATTDTDQEIAFAKKQLAEEESKVKHLTALLADTEQDLAKHVQMNKLLKEEIRRQQRSEEREKHAENLEYLKNVVFKFVTLHSGDERSRLVPVLNTILKLSPEETQKLSIVAKGDQGLRGWSNYLPTWSPSSKS